MAKKEVSKTIDGKKYTFYQLPPRKSVKTLFRLMNIIGPSLGSVVGSAKDVKTIEDLFSADIDLSKVLGSLFDRIDEDKVWGIMEDVLSQTICEDGKGEIDIDIHFKGDIQTLFKVVFEAIKVEYGSFFAGKFDLEGALQGKGPDTIQGS